VIPNGIAFDDIDAVPFMELDQIAPHGDRVVVYAGRLHRDKKLDTLIQAMSHVAATIPSVLLICGDGPAGPDLKCLADSLGLAGRVRFLGHLPRRRLLVLLKSADLFAFPSAYEGQPNVVLEAIACGCPIAVSDIPAHREFLTEASSLFVDPCDADGLARAISQALGHPEQARARAVRARERVSGWSTARVAEEYIRVYETVLARRQRGVQSTNRAGCSTVEAQRRTGAERLADET
jgi:glycosyltransferase involved in cell wall biosynthesis